MLSNYTLLTDSDYETLRFNILVNVEEGGDPKEEPYLDSKEIPTIGIGFNLLVQNVRNLVLQAFGIDTNSTNSAELGYISDINNILSMNWQGNVTGMITALNDVMYRRANDNSVVDLNGGIKRSVFAFKNDTEIQGVFNGLIGQYENNIDEWLPGIPNSNEREALVSLSWNGLIGIQRDINGNIITDSQGNPLYKSPNLRDAIIKDDRVRAWFEIRYGSNKDQSAGTAKRRYWESAIFGLYNDKFNASGEAQHIIEYLLGTPQYTSGIGGVGAGASSRLEQMIVKRGR